MLRSASAAVLAALWPHAAASSRALRLLLCVAAFSDELLQRAPSRLEPACPLRRTPFGPACRGCRAVR
eukprot:500465-Alexandrium_andersonii.AAC.1